MSEIKKDSELFTASLTKENVELLIESDTSKVTSSHRESRDLTDDNESADVFATLGSNVLPWHRASTIRSTESDRLERKLRSVHETDTSMYKEISDMTRSVYDSFSSREEVLRTSYANTRFYMIENFVSTEMIKYEMLLKELRDNSDLNLMEEVDVKLHLDSDCNVGLDEFRDHKLADTKTTWQMKILKASEDFTNKSSLVRSMFRRTHDFFNELNEMEYQYVTKQHIRELSKQTILHKLRAHEDCSASMTERLNDLEAYQQKELQNLKYHNLKEIYVRMLQKEWAAMDNHLGMLEVLYQMLNKVYIEVMNMKIRHIIEWHAYREKQDKSLNDIVRRLKEECYSEFQQRKDEERDMELNQVKRSAEEDREERLKIFDDAQSVVSSELVFGITMKKNKNIFLVDDTSSDGTFDMVDEDLSDIKDSSKNAEFLKLIRKRIRVKVLIEKKYNDKLKSEVDARRQGEINYLDSNRRRERDYLKHNMEKYFTKEKELETKIQNFLTEEKAAIDSLKRKQNCELDLVVQGHEAHVEKVRRKETENNKDLTTTNSTQDKSVPQNDNMITAHVLHEMRNVLSSILCLGENLKQDPSTLETVVLEQSDICNYALEVCNDMIDISKIKNSNYKAQIEKVNVSDLFDKVIKIQGVRARSGVSVKKQMDSVLIDVATERKLLLQLLINLLSNSVKFTHQGQITLYCETLTQCGVRCAKIGVADTGVGVRQEVNEKVNNTDANSILSFLETHSEVSKEEVDYSLTEYSVRNSGYGLYLASTIAKVLSSSLKVVSPLTHEKANGLPVHIDSPGSFFYIVLPLYKEKKAKEQDPHLSSQKSTDPAGSTMTKVSLEELIVTSPKRRVSLTFSSPAALSSELTAKKRASITTFVPLPLVPLPCSEPTESIEPTEYTAKPQKFWKFCPSGHMTVLIVDDQKLLRQTMVLIFKHLCEQFPEFTVSIETACSAEEAYRKHKTSNFDFISMDEFYDTTMLIKNTLRAESNMNRAILTLGADTELNRTNYIQFAKHQEQFTILPSDGKLLGTEIIRSLKKLSSKPIIISCTGSDHVRHPYILHKPYSLQRLVQLLEDHMVDFMKDGSLHLNSHVVRRSSELTLFKMCEINMSNLN